MTVSDDREEIIKAHCEAGSFDDALTCAIEVYGAEVYGFLAARLASEDWASEVFAQASEDLWRSLESFKWQCSMRTWMYKLARSAAVRYERAPANRKDRRAASFRFSAVAEELRSRTAPHLRTEIKDSFQRLREELPREDQTLLVLRVNRGLSWVEVARVLEEADQLDDDELRRASARIRQRFQSIKERLRERAIAEGLVQES